MIQRSPVNSRARPPKALSPKAPKGGSDPSAADETPRRGAGELLMDDVRGLADDAMGLVALHLEKGRSKVRKILWTALAVLAIGVAVFVLAVVAIARFVAGLAGGISQLLGAPLWVGSLGAAVVILGGMVLAAWWLRRSYERAAIRRVRRAGEPTGTVDARR